MTKDNASTALFKAIRAYAESRAKARAMIQENDEAGVGRDIPYMQQFDEATEAARVKLANRLEGMPPDDIIRAFFCYLGSLPRH